jgi:hypothetical protein
VFGDGEGWEEEEVERGLVKVACGRLEVGCELDECVGSGVVRVRGRSVVLLLLLLLLLVLLLILLVLLLVLNLLLLYLLKVSICCSDVLWSGALSGRVTEV